MASGSHLSVFLCLTSALLISGTAASCLPGWAELKSRCFILFDSSCSFADAEVAGSEFGVNNMKYGSILPCTINHATFKSICQRFGAHLAAIHNQEEQNFISNLIYQKFADFPKIWIGLTDAKLEGKFKWTDGSRTDFLPWAPSQPDNWADEDCAVMNFEGGPKWDDVVCQKEYPFVCARTQ